MLKKDSKIYVAGHRGMVGSAIVRALIAANYTNIVVQNRAELDLLNQQDVFDFFRENKFEFVFLAAAKVGGIAANIAAPADFLYENLVLQTNIIHAAYRTNVKKLLFLASSCIYPRMCPQPMKEEYLLDGKVEPTNEGYALAKICGLKLCQMYNEQYSTNFVSLMPCNIYGIGDNFDPKKSHVVAALLAKFHEAKEKKLPFVSVWGTGKARRELLFVDDLADACLHVMNHYSGKEFFNIGSGVDHSIAELAACIQRVVGYAGEIQFDSTKPDGMPQKLMDVTKAKNELGWKHRVSLENGLKQTYDYYLRLVVE